MYWHKMKEELPEMSSKDYSIPCLIIVSGTFKNELKKLGGGS